MKAPAPTARRLAAVLATLLAAGCAATAGTDETARDRDDPVQVTVDNSQTPRAQATVYIVPDSGVRQHLGTVTPGEVATFTFDDPLVAGQYALVADLGTQSVTSRSFTLSPGAPVEWDLETNAIFFGRESVPLRTP